MKKKVFLSIVVISFLCTIYQSAFAWGRIGHSIVAEVAFRNLDEKTKANVIKFLYGLTIEEAANWMDEQRGNSTYDYLKPLHYINVENGNKYDPNSTNNLISELNRIKADFEKLNTLTDEAIKMDLFELFHLIGDLHQPLHVGYGEDKGGNTYQVQFNGNGTNLHKVWDSEIIEYKSITLDDVLNYGNVTVNSDFIPLDWMNENRMLLKDIYPSNHKISEAYIETNTPIIKKQLLVAGMRLLNILNTYFRDFNRTPNFVHKSYEITEISLNDINSNINKDVRICAKVYSAKQLSSGITFLNVGADYPNSPLTVVVLKMT